MRRRYAALAGVALVVVLVFSFWLWYTWPAPISQEAKAAVLSALQGQFPEVSWRAPERQTGHLGKYTILCAGTRQLVGDEVTALVRLTRGTAGLEVENVELMIGGRPGLGLRVALTVGAAAGVAYAAMRLLPLSGRRCPRDRAPLRRSEITVLGSCFSPQGITRPAIIERTYACPRCDFRHIEALPDPDHRPAGHGLQWVPLPPTVDERWEQRLRRREEERMAGAMTEQEYQKRLQEARAQARARSSSDSPWRR